MKKDIRSLKTEEAISEAFLTLLAQNTSKRITISAIAKQARIGRKTFYLHFSSIEDIISSLETNIEKTIYQRTVSFFKVHPVGEAVLIFNDLNTLIQPNLSLLNGIANTAYFPSFRDLCKKAIASSVKYFCQSFLTLTSQEVAFNVDFFSSGISEVYTSFFKNPGQTPVEKIGQQVANAVMSGLFGFTKSGLKMEQVH